MIRFLGTCEIARPPEVTFQALADMAELDRWNPNVSRSDRISGGYLEIASTYESVICRGPIRMTARSELVAIDTPQMVEYEGSISVFWSVDRLMFEPTADGTRVTFFNESTPPKWLTPFTALFNASFQTQAQRAVDGAKRYVESQ